MTGKDCPRTVHEPIHEPIHEQPTPRPAIHRVALTAVEAIRQRPVNPARCRTDLKTISGLWAAEGKPDPDEFGADLLRVIAWARESSDPLAARDIRAEGWASGTNRCRDLATICVQSRWGARVDAARLWDERGRKSPTDKRIAADTAWREMVANRWPTEGPAAMALRALGGSSAVKARTAFDEPRMRDRFIAEFERHSQQEAAK